MSSFSEYIGSQFRNPTGVIGAICCRIMNIINKTMYKRTIDFIKLPVEAKVLDIGYGNGYLLKLIDKSYKAEFYGIDISEDMKQLAFKKNKNAVKSGRMHLSVGDCCNLPFDDNFFDAVTTINTVYFWKDTIKGLREIRRCLMQGMCFYNVVYTKEWLDTLSYTEKGFKKFESEELKELGYEAGFTEVKIQEIIKGKSFVVIYKK